MFDISIGRFVINGNEVPIYYKDGIYYLNFRKLRNSVNDYAEKNCDRVLKRIDLKEKKDYIADVVKGGSRTQYFITEEAAITYLDSLKHLTTLEVNEYVKIIRNNIIKHKNFIEKNRDYATEENSYDESENGDITELENRTHSIDKVCVSHKLYDDTCDQDSYVASLLTNLIISVDNVIQRQNEFAEQIDELNEKIDEFDEKLNYLNEEIENIGNSDEDLILDDPSKSNSKTKTIYDALAVICSSLATWLDKNHHRKLTSLCYEQSNKCLKIASDIFDNMSEYEKEVKDNQKIKI